MMNCACNTLASFDGEIESRMRKNWLSRFDVTVKPDQYTRIFGNKKSNVTTPITAKKATTLTNVDFDFLGIIEKQFHQFGFLGKGTTPFELQPHENLIF